MLTRAAQEVPSETPKDTNMGEAAVLGLVTGHTQDVPQRVTKERVDISGDVAPCRYKGGRATRTPERSAPHTRDGHECLGEFKGILKTPRRDGSDIGGGPTYVGPPYGEGFLNQD